KGPWASNTLHWSARRSGHIAASRPHNVVPVPGSNLERTPAVAGRGLERYDVLLPQLIAHLARGVAGIGRRARIEESAARPGCEIFDVAVDGFAGGCLP